MLWSEVIQDAQLQNLPYKIELDHYGRILMSPASNRHGTFQYYLGSLLERHCPDGMVMTECSIETSQGVKVADVVWRSVDFIKKNGHETPYSQAPEICVEIISPSNTDEEMQEKIQLYLNQGSQEVWICDLNGNIEWYGAEGKLAQSKIAPHAANMLEV